MLSSPTHSDATSAALIDPPICLPMESLIARLADKHAGIGIIGLGYVGVPLAITVTRAGFSVIGFDIDSSRVSLLNDGRSTLPHMPDNIVEAMHSSGKFQATTDFALLANVDVILICVPTPLTRYCEPDLSFIERCSEEIAKRLRVGQAIILESSTWPGTTCERAKAIFERSGLQCGSDFFLGFSPEREDPGNTHFNTTDIPKVIGADDPSSAQIIELFYKQIIGTTVAVSSTRTAEAVKLTENIFRFVNISLVNELKIIYEEMGIDIWEVIDAAKSKPFGFMAFYPGPGLGGHCIPVDPYYLTWKAREFGLRTKFIELAGEINSGMAAFVVDRLSSALDERYNKGLAGSRILILGLAYKANVADTRESPAFHLARILMKRGASIEYHDPYVPEFPLVEGCEPLTGRRSVELKKGTATRFDAVLIITDHRNVDYATIAADAPLVIDTRNVCRRSGISLANVVAA